MIASELSDLAGETDTTIGEQDLSFADAAGVEEELTRGGVARRALVAEAEGSSPPSGIQHASPLHRTWIRRSRYGSMLSNLVQVSGAAACSKRALNANLPTVIRTSAMIADYGHVGPHRPSVAPHRTSTVGDMTCRRRKRGSIFLSRSEPDDDDRSAPLARKH